MLKFLSDKLNNSLEKIGFENINEIRIRADKPVCVQTKTARSYLGNNGASSARDAFRINKNEIEDIVFIATEKSIYAFESQIKSGFITTKEGIRIGLGGTYVYSGESLHTIRDFTSLCIRLPHPIEDCSRVFYEKYLRKELSSVLIISPPGYGKTTFLRDLCRIVSDEKKINVLLVDERNELSAFDVGERTDIVRFGRKEEVFTAGIRAMCPELIVTDELQGKDWESVGMLVKSGINFFASAHLSETTYIPKNVFKYVVRLEKDHTWSVV